MIWTSATFKGLTESAQKRVVGFTTTREGGVSQPPYSGLNIAEHVDDNLAEVMANRAILREEAQLPSEPYWLNQTHSTTSVELPYEYRRHMEADASFTTRTNTVCTVMTADCLPLLIVDKNATVVSAIHAGWRGLLDGIIENTIKRLPVPAEELSVWIGPAISKQAFEVGEEVKVAFVKQYPHSEAFFTLGGHTDKEKSLTAKGVQKDTQTNEGTKRHVPVKFLADLPAIASMVLTNLGVSHISLSNECTYADELHYYSYRRDGVCGRMASLIWLKGDIS